LSLRVKSDQNKAAKKVVGSERGKARKKRNRSQRVFRVVQLRSKRAGQSRREASRVLVAESAAEVNPLPSNPTVDPNRGAEAKEAVAEKKSQDRGAVDQSEANVERNRGKADLERESQAGRNVVRNQGKADLERESQAGRNVGRNQGKADRVKGNRAVANAGRKGGRGQRSARVVEVNQNPGQDRNRSRREAGSAAGLSRCPSNRIAARNPSEEEEVAEARKGPVDQSPENQKVADARNEKQDDENPKVVVRKSAELLAEKGQSRKAAVLRSGRHHDERSPGVVLRKSVNLCEEASRKAVVPKSAELLEKRNLVEARKGPSRNRLEVESLAAVLSRFL